MKNVASGQHSLEDAERLKLRIVEVALEMGDEAGVVSNAELLERFPGCEAAVAAALRALGLYATRVARDRRVARADVTDELLECGAVVGDYEIECVIGHGTMGVVYRARQRSLGARAVALKVLPPALVARDPRFLERFRREAALASEVHDAHLAEVYGFGEEDGLVFFAMQLIEGRTLGDVLKSLLVRKRLGDQKHLGHEYVVRVVRLMREVALATQALHERGLVHRDIKPSNIILEGSKEDDLEALARPPVLVDFGLLKPVQDSGLTGSQTLLGTPAYASPEAKLGREVGTRADVFALGAILYELLSLTTAGSRTSAPWSLRASADSRARKPAGLHSVRALNPAVDERLDAIIGMALDDRAELRYADGGALLNEFERYLNDEPVHAFPETAVGRARLWRRRNPERATRLVAVGGLAAMLLGIVAFVVGAWIFPLFRAADRAGELEAAGDLRGARDEWSLVFASAWGGILPLPSGGRARAAEYWAPGGLLGPPLGALEAGEVDAGQLGLRRVYFASDADEERELILSFLAFELGPSSTAERRLAAAESAAKLLTRAPADFGAAGTTRTRLRDALLEVAAQERQAPSADPLVLRYVISALGGTGCVEALRAVLPSLSSTDDELQRVSSVASIRLWWALRGATKQQAGGGTEYYVDLLNLDQSLWVDWAAQIWAGMQRHMRADAATHDELLESLVIRAAASAASSLAWTRMDLAAADRLDEALWQALPEQWLAYIEAVQHALAGVRDGRLQDQDPLRGVPLPRCGDSWTWTYPLTNTKRYFEERSLPTSPYSYPVPPPYRPTLATITGSPSPGARLASVAFVDGTTTEEQVILTGAASAFTWSGAITVQKDWTHLTLRGLDSRAELTCQGRPADGLVARIRITYDCPAIFPLPHSGGARMRISINDGELVTERFCYMSSETLEILVPEMVLAMQPELTIQIGMRSESILWIHRIEVVYEPLDE